MYNFTVMLSASIPAKDRDSQYFKVPDAQLQVEDAVVALARAVLGNGGRIITGGHPSISPLLSTVAMEFPALSTQSFNSSTNTQDRIAPVTIYLSKAFEDYFPPSTLSLASTSFARIVQVDAAPGEKFNPELPYPQCPRSLTRLRNTLIEQKPDGMVCIGGMDGVEEEFRLFQRSYRPIYLLTDTGGATRLLVNEKEKSNNLNVHILSKQQLLPNPDDSKGETNNIIDVVPYVYFATKIVQDLQERSR